MPLRPSSVHIVGVAETPLGEVTDQTELSMVALAAREALEEAGLTLADVDGVFTNYMGDMGAVQVSSYLGLQPRVFDSTDLGGAAFPAHIKHAWSAIATGRCETALVTYASRQRSRRSRSAVTTEDAGSLTAQFDEPYGPFDPIGYYALMAARHMHEFGTTHEQLAEIAVAARAWARLNPKAWSRGPLDVADVIASRPICSPLHKLDCCLVTDGGAAIVLTTSERARDARKPSVAVLGTGEAHTHYRVPDMPSLVHTAAERSGRQAFQMAGVQPDDVDFLQPYDSFTISALLALEDLGFCAKGEGGSFVEGGTLAPGGALPAMTSGGGLSYNHPGALGLLLVVEAVRQLRGEAGERQVPDARLGVVHGVGGYCSATATVVLGNV